MITLHEEITVDRTVEDCFRYVADFRTAPEWDATAVRSIKTTKGPVAAGSRFLVDCRVGPTTLRLEYEIIEYEPWSSLVLVARGSLFDARDTITFTQCEEGTRISYTADFTYRWGLSRLEGGMETGMRKMGAQSLAGLKAALEQPVPTPTLSACNARSDRWVMPGVALFSRWGFTRSLKSRQPTTRFLDGQHVLLTGANSGLGLATAIDLAEAGADLTLVIRNSTKKEALLKTLSEATGRRDVSIEYADLSLLADVEALAERLITAGKPIDVLINNAGALYPERQVTTENLEQSFALLLLSPWHLTRRLHPLLANHPSPARVINVVSGGMYTERLVCDRLIMPAETYQGAQAYARAKRALTVLTELWAEAWRADNIVVNAMHPGWADTPGVASALPTFRSITRRILRSPEEGADTISWLARAGEADTLTGKLYLDREPRTPYLLERTRERPEERENLEAFLESKLTNILTE